MKLVSWFKNNWIKVLVIIILFYSLSDQPYSYYQMLRWVVMIASGYLAITSYEVKKIGWVWLFAIIAILFNPIVPFYLAKDTWQLADVVVLVIYIIALVTKEPKKR